MSMVEAVSAARFSATSNMIDVSNRIPWGVQRELEREGYEVVRSPRPTASPPCTRFACTRTAWMAARTPATMAS
jgi:hypothetical protein